MNEGQKLKEQGMNLVFDASPTGWKLEVSVALFSFDDGVELIGEDIRKRVASQPKHPNAWGAIINRYVRKGILVPTGNYIQSKSPANHARRVQVYRLCKAAAWGGNGYE